MPERYQSSDQVIATQLGDEAVLLHLKSQRYYTLNETGLAIWALLAEPRDADGVAARLATDYDISPEQAAEVAHRFITQLAADRLIRKC